LVWRVGQLSRSLPHLLEIVRGLAERGIRFRSSQEANDTTTPGAVLSGSGGHLELTWTSSIPGMIIW
jgi:DNA invertase Pin-like site-specific DNA recombinase